MANQISGLSFVLDARIEGFRRSMAEASGSLRALQKQTQSFQNILAGAGVAFGAFQVGSFIVNSINTFKEFEFTMSEVKAITNATAEEFKKLEADAIRLGRSTVFTAKEVGTLQVAYGRLGFTTKEILNATEATLDLAAATNSDLADAAEVAGSTVRGFQLDAAETIRVTDVMASSFNKTALDITSFREAMKFVAPVANAAGASIEETTALLGVLANAGIKGSIAGTSLRRIFSDLTQDGRPLRDRLVELASKGLTLKDAFDEIGRVSQTSLLVLSKNVEAADDLTAAFQRAEGETKRVAEIRLDNLQGDIIRLQSAWEGFLINLQSVNTEASVFRSILQDLTSVVNNFGGAISDNNGILNTWLQTVTAFPRGVLSILSGNARFFRSNEELNLSIQENIKALERQSLEASRFGNTDNVKRYNEEIRQLKLQLENIGGTQNELTLNALQKEIEETISQLRELEIVYGESANTDALKSRLSNLEGQYKRLSETITATVPTIEQFNNSFRSFTDGLSGGANVTDRVDQIIKAFQTLGKDSSASLELLGEARGRLLKQFDQIEAGNTRELEQKGALIRKIQEEIDKLEAFRNKLKQVKAEAVKDPIRIDVEFNFPGTGTTFDFDKELKDSLFQSNFIKQLQPGEQLLFEGVDFETGLANFQTFTEGYTETADEYQKATENIRNTTNIFTGLFTNFGTAIGDAIAGVGSFGDAILKTLADFAAQFGAILIATGFAEESFKKFKGMIPAGAALIVASQVVKGVIARRPKLGGGGGGGSTGGSSSFAFAQDSAPVRLISDIQIKGQDLYVVLSNYEKNNRNTRNG